MDLRTRPRALRARRDAPVFVDPSGRRMRTARWVALAAAAAAGCYLVILLGAVLFGPTVRIPGLPFLPQPASNSPLQAARFAAPQAPPHDVPSPTTTPRPVVQPVAAQPNPLQSGASRAPAPSATPAPTAAPARPSAPASTHSATAPGQTKRPTPPQHP